MPVLKKLRLSGVLQSLEVRVRQAVDAQLSHEEFLVRLLSDEVDRRDGRQFDQRVRRAGFDSLKTLEDFDFQFNPRGPKAKVIDLATCSFVERRQNVLLVGQAGVGKSHIAQALGHRACRAGYQVLYVGAGDMLKQLRAGRADGSYDRRLARLVGVDLLIVDDLGLRSLTVEEAADVYEVIRLRYQRGAMILTSNQTEYN
ncbi:IS21-like element helper ATPase IstB [Sorangium sp. So ce233]|uniref:IS21-like element helper ATPase IstB n=1 Tax=Sorangium sp. So ce233 TaxID=3133290 RepID=UPI003F636F49